MVPIPEGENIEKLNEKILVPCYKYGKHKIAGHNRTIIERFVSERESPIELPKVPFSSIQLRETTIDKYAPVTVDKNRYSVPTRYAGCKATVLLGANSLAIFVFRKKIAMHKRNYGKRECCFDPNHYLELIKQQPSSFASARAIQQWSKTWPKSLTLMLDKIRSRYSQSKGTRNFVSLLMLYRTYNSDEIEAAVELALESGVADNTGLKY